MGSAGALVLLALTDSLSFGTLLIPVWFLMTPGRIYLSRVFLYLAAVTSSYFVIGIILMAGGRLLFESASGFLQSSTALVGQLVIGLILLGASFALDTKAARSRAAERNARSGTVKRWRERAVTEGSATSLIVLALLAVLVEVSSMLPYIVATKIIATEIAAWPVSLIVLAAYCAVMVAPALVLTVCRVIAKPLVERPLSKLDDWLSSHSRSTTLWIIGIAGFFLAATAFQDLGGI